MTCEGTGKASDIALGHCPARSRHRMNCGAHRNRNHGLPTPPDETRIHDKGWSGIKTEKKETDKREQRTISDFFCFCFVLCSSFVASLIESSLNRTVWQKEMLISLVISRGNFQIVETCGCVYQRGIRYKLCVR